MGAKSFGFYFVITRACEILSYPFMCSRLTNVTPLLAGGVEMFNIDESEQLQFPFSKFNFFVRFLRQPMLHDNKYIYRSNANNLHSE